MKVGPGDSFTLVRGRADQGNTASVEGSLRHHQGPTRPVDSVWSSDLGLGLGLGCTQHHQLWRSRKQFAWILASRYGCNLKLNENLQTSVWRPNL